MIFLLTGASAVDKINVIRDINSFVEVTTRDPDLPASMPNLPVTFAPCQVVGGQVTSVGVASCSNDYAFDSGPAYFVEGRFYYDNGPDERFDMALNFSSTFTQFFFAYGFYVEYSEVGYFYGDYDAILIGLGLAPDRDVTIESDPRPLDDFYYFTEGHLAYEGAISPTVRRVTKGHGRQNVTHTFRFWNEALQEVPVFRISHNLVWSGTVNNYTIFDFDLLYAVGNENQTEPPPDEEFLSIPEARIIESWTPSRRPEDNGFPIAPQFVNSQPNKIDRIYVVSQNITVELPVPLVFGDILYIQYRFVNSYRDKNFIITTTGPTFELLEPDRFPNEPFLWKNGLGFITLQACANASCIPVDLGDTEFGSAVPDYNAVEDSLIATLAFSLTEGTSTLNFSCSELSQSFQEGTCCDINPFLHNAFFTTIDTSLFCLDQTERQCSSSLYTANALSLNPAIRDIDIVLQPFEVGTPMSSRKGFWDSELTEPRFLSDFSAATEDVLVSTTCFWGNITVDLSSVVDERNFNNTRDQLIIASDGIVSFRIFSETSNPYLARVNELLEPLEKLAVLTFILGETATNFPTMNLTAYHPNLILFNVTSGYVGSNLVVTMAQTAARHMVAYITDPSGPILPDLCLFRQYESIHYHWIQNVTAGDSVDTVAQTIASFTQNMALRVETVDSLTYGFPSLNQTHMRSIILFDETNLEGTLPEEYGLNAQLNAIHIKALAVNEFPTWLPGLDFLESVVLLQLFSSPVFIPVESLVVSAFYFVVRGELQVFIDQELALCSRECSIARSLPSINQFQVCSLTTVSSCCGIPCDDYQGTADAANLIKQEIWEQEYLDQWLENGTSLQSVETFTLEDLNALYDSSMDPLNGTFEWVLNLALFESLVQDPRSARWPSLPGVCEDPSSYEVGIMDFHTSIATVHSSATRSFYPGDRCGPFQGYRVNYASPDQPQFDLGSLTDSCKNADLEYHSRLIFYNASVDNSLSNRLLLPSGQNEFTWPTDGFVPVSCTRYAYAALDVGPGTVSPTSLNYDFMLNTQRDKMLWFSTHKNKYPTALAHLSMFICSATEMRYIRVKESVLPSNVFGPGSAFSAAPVPLKIRGMVFENNDMPTELTSNFASLLPNLHTLTFRNTRLTGTIPTSFWSLSFINLDLSFNTVDGTLTSSVVNRQYIDYFDIRNTFISGTLNANDTLCTNPPPRCHLSDFVSCVGSCGCGGGDQTCRSVDPIPTIGARQSLLPPAPSEVAQDVVILNDQYIALSWESSGMLIVRLYENITSPSLVSGVMSAAATDRVTLAASVDTLVVSPIDLGTDDHAQVSYTLNPSNQLVLNSTLFFTTTNVTTFSPYRTEVFNRNAGSPLTEFMAPRNGAKVYSLPDFSLLVDYQQDDWIEALHKDINDDGLTDHVYMRRGGSLLENPSVCDSYPELCASNATQEEAVYVLAYRLAINSTTLDEEVVLFSGNYPVDEVYSTFAIGDFTFSNGTDLYFRYRQYLVLCENVNTYQGTNCSIVESTGVRSIIASLSDLNGQLPLGIVYRKSDPTLMGDVMVIREKGFSPASTSETLVGPIHGATFFIENDVNYLIYSDGDSGEFFYHVVTLP